MKSLIFALATLVIGGGVAQADELAPNAVAPSAYVCHVRGRVEGKSVAVIVGGQYIYGPGVVSCKNTATGKIHKVPVTLKITGFGVGLDLTVIKRVDVVSAGIGINDPNLLVNSFAIGASAGASLIRAGLEFDMALQLSAQNGLGFEVGMQGRDIVGLGAHLYAMTFAIENR